MAFSLLRQSASLALGNTSLTKDPNHCYITYNLQLLV